MVLPRSVTGLTVTSTRVDPRAGCRLTHDKGAAHGRCRTCRTGPGDLDRRHRIDDREARGVRPGGGRAGREGDRLPGGLQRPVLLPGAGGRALPLGRTGARRPDRPADAGPGPRDRHGDRRPGLRDGAGRLLLQHRRRHRRRRHLLGKYRKHHIPQVKGFWEKYYFRPGNLGWPVFDTAVGRVGVYICYDRHFPEGWRALGLAGAQLVYNPSATCRGLSAYLWQLEQPAAAVANEYFIAAINRVGLEEYGDNDFYGTSYFVDPRGQFVGGVASDKKEELVVRDLDFDLIDEVRQQWAFYRDRRPDAYDGLVQP